ncbi:MAG: large conductance mechanosensitive channel protein MscL [Dysosmobacter welbionis]
MTELTKKTTGFLAEFRQFIARGNVLDMAVGVIIGGAFGKISTSLVNDILMPLLSLLTGGADFSQWQWVLREAVYDAGGNEVRAAVAINYGSFFSTILTSSSSPLRSSASSKLSTASTERRRPLLLPPQPSQEEVLLAEIRDLLKERT